MKRFMLFLLVLVLVMLPLSMALAQGGNADTLVFGLPSDADATFNSMVISTVNSSLVTRYIWPRLSELDPMTGEPIPSLATWDISDDGLVYTFHIREDANWSDGTPITAEDVKFTFDAPKSDKVQSPNASRFAQVKEINVVDDKTVQIVLTEVSCSALYDLQLGIMPAHKFAPDYSDFMESEFNFKPDVGGAAYVLDERSPDEFIRLTANPYYFKGKPKIENFVFKVIVDAAVIREALVAGEVDWMERITPDDADFLKQYDYLDQYNMASNRLVAIWFNHADPTNPMNAYDENGNLNDQGHHPIFGDVRVRKAFVMGWNHDDYIKLLGDGPRRIPGPITSAISWALNTDIDLYPYDPEGAAALLDEAGWTMNDQTGVRECHGCMYAEEGTPLEFELDYSPGLLQADSQAIIIQDQLGSIGMKVNVQGVELGTFVGEVMYGEKFDTLTIGFSGSDPNPDDLTRSLLYSHNDVTGGGGFNVGSYVNPEVDKLIVEANSMPGCKVEDRAPLYYEIQRLAHEDVAYDFVTDRVSITGLNKRIGNVVYGPWDFNDISEWTLEQ